MSETLKERLKKDPYHFKIIDHSYKNLNFVSDLLDEQIDVTPYLNEVLLSDETIVEKSILLNPENIKYFSSASWKWQKLAIKNNIACINDIISYNRSTNENEKLIRIFKETFYEKNISFKRIISENEALLNKAYMNWFSKGEFLKSIMNNENEKFQDLLHFIPNEAAEPFLRDMLKLQNGLDLTNINDMMEYQEKLNQTYQSKMPFNSLSKEKCKAYVINMIPDDKLLIGLAFDLEAMVRNKGLKEVIIKDSEIIGWLLEIDGKLLKYFEEFQNDKTMIRKAVLNNEKAFHFIDNGLKRDVSFLMELININEEVFFETDNDSFELAEFMVNEVNPRYIKHIPSAFIFNKKLLFKFLEENKLEDIIIDLNDYKELYTEDKYIRLLLKNNGQYFWTMPDKVRKNKEYLILALNSEPNLIIKERLPAKFLEDEDIAKLAAKTGVVSRFLSKIDLNTRFIYRNLPEELEGSTLIGLESFSSTLLNNSFFMKEAVRRNKSNIAVAPKDFLKKENLKDIDFIDFDNLSRFQNSQLWTEEVSDDLYIELHEKAFNYKLELNSNALEISKVIISLNLLKKHMELNKPENGPDPYEVNFCFKLLERIPLIYEYFSEKIRSNKTLAIKAIQTDFKNIKFVCKDLREFDREVALSILNSSLHKRKKLSEKELFSLKGSTFEEIICNYASEYDHDFLKFLILHNPDKKERINYLSLSHKSIIKVIVKTKQLTTEELYYLLDLKDSFINYLILNFQKNAFIIFEDETYKGEFFFGMKEAISKITCLYPKSDNYKNHCIIKGELPTLQERAILRLNISKEQLFNYAYLTPYRLKETFKEMNILNIPVDKDFVIRLIRESNIQNFESFVKDKLSPLNTNGKDEFKAEIHKGLYKLIKKAKIHYRKSFEERMKFLLFLPEELKSDTEIIMEYIRYGGSNLTYFNISITEIVSGFIINSSTGDNKFKSKILESKFKNESNKRVEFLEVVSSIFSFSNLIDIEILIKEIEINRKKIESYLKNPVFKDELFYIMEFLMLGQSEKQLFLTLNWNFETFLNYIRTYLLEERYSNEKNNKKLIKKLFPTLDISGQEDFFNKCKKEFKNQLGISSETISDEFKSFITSAFELEPLPLYLSDSNEKFKIIGEYNLHYNKQIHPIINFLPPKSRKGKNYINFCKCIKLLMRNKTISYKEIKNIYENSSKINFPDIYRKYVLKYLESFSVEFNNIFLKEKYELYFDKNNKEELLKLKEIIELNQ